MNYYHVLIKNNLVIYVVKKKIPVPPATSNNRVRGLGSSVFINSSFHIL